MLSSLNGTLKISLYHDIKLFKKVFTWERERESERQTIAYENISKI